MDEAQWQQALESGQGALSGGESWDEAVWFSSSQKPSGAPTLDFEAFWKYCQARRIWLLGRFHTGGGESLLPAEAKAANEYLQADMIPLAEAQHSLAVRPSQALTSGSRCRMSTTFGA